MIGKNAVSHALLAAGAYLIGIELSHAYNIQIPELVMEERPAPQTPVCLGLYKGNLVLDASRIAAQVTPIPFDVPSPSTVPGYCVADKVMQKRFFFKHKSKPPYSTLYCRAEDFVPLQVGDYLCTHNQQSIDENKELKDTLDAATKRLGELEKRIRALEGKP